MTATDRLKVALVQPTAERDLEPNIRAVGSMVREAAAAGADFILTPENVGMMEPIRTQAIAKSRAEAEHPTLIAFQELAAETGKWLLAGSLAIRLSEEKLANRSFLIDPTGRIVARYSKIHMFDVDLGNGESYRESRTYQPGDRAVLAETPWGTLGMTICYDVRFPHLYRHLAQAGAAILTIPSAFTAVTGAAHWHILLRARAIETGCFVLAPAQTGTHAEGRRTYGHSLVVSPWGEVLADGGDAVGVSYAELDLGAVADARRRVPSLGHDRTYTPAEASRIAAAAE